MPSQSTIINQQSTIPWVSPRALNRVDIIEHFDQLDEMQIFERDPDWFHSFQENGTLFGHISIAGLKVLSRMKMLETVKVEITEAQEPKRLCAISTVKATNNNFQLGGAYSVLVERENAKLVAEEMALRNAYKQLISEADWTLFLVKDRVYFAHPIFKKDSEDAAIVKNLIKEKIGGVLLDPARILRLKEPPNVAFNLGFNCIRHSKTVVFMTSDSGFVTKGVFRELQRAFQLNKEVFLCKLQRHDSGLCKAELLSVSAQQIVPLKRNNPNEFGSVII